MQKVSIIIPVKEINDYIRESMPYFLALDYANYEILIFPDEPSPEQFQKTKIIASGKVGPAEKRDLSIQYATGEIFAFIDDDAYPRKDWLKNAVNALDPVDVGAVGGPAVTVESDGIMCRAGGKVYESFLCSGKYTYRYVQGVAHDDDDIPSVNLIVKRDVFEAVGGYDSNFYPGEDTKLCLDITRKAKKRLLYCPDVLVYHHRRPLFRSHLKQATNYAKHRGYFAKVLPETSLRIQYFVPTLFMMGVFLGPIISIFIPFLWWIYLGVLLFYFVLAGFSVKNTGNFKIFILAVCGIFLTHLGYGICFLQGLFSKKLIR